MKVRELIEALRHLPEDSLVVTGSGFEISPISGVEEAVLDKAPDGSYADAGAFPEDLGNEKVTAVLIRR